MAVKIELDGKQFDIPEADLDWFIKEKGAKKVGGAAKKPVAKKVAPKKDLKQDEEK